MCLLQGYRRCTVEKPKTSTTIARRNSCHEGKKLCGCVYMCVSMSPVSLHSVCVWCYLFEYNCELTKTYLCGSVW